MSSVRVGIEDARKVLGDLVTAAQQGTDIVLTRGRSHRPVARLVSYQDVASRLVGPISDGGRTAVARVVESTIEHEYGRATTADLASVTSAAVATLAADLDEAFRRQTGTDQGLGLYSVSALRELVDEALAERVCQCRSLHPRQCPHESTSGSLWCDGHYEADVPPLGGALLCGTCYIGEYQARGGE